MGIPKNQQIIWTKGDEDLLQELTARKKAFKRTHGDALLTFMDRVGLPFKTNSSTKGAILEWMIENADEIRDLLNSFDSGERPPEVIS